MTKDSAMLSQQGQIAESLAALLRSVDFIFYL